MENCRPVLPEQIINEMKTSQFELNTEQDII